MHELPDLEPLRLHRRVVGLGTSTSYLPRRGRPQGRGRGVVSRGVLPRPQHSGDIPQMDGDNARDGATRYGGNRRSLQVSL